MIMMIRKALAQMTVPEVIYIQVTTPQLTGSRCHGLTNFLRWAEESRASMSTALATNLTSGSVDASLAEIETKTRDAQWSSTGDIVIGPFGVLNPNVATGMEIAQASPPDETRSHAEHTVSRTLNSPSSPLVDSPLDPGEFLHWADIFSLESGLMGATSQIPWTMDCHDFASGVPIIETGIPSISQGRNQGGRATHECTQGQHETGPTITPQQSPEDPVSPPMDILPDAPFLLKHFQDHVVTQIMSLPIGHRSPWSVINIPAAVLTLSDLTYLGRQDVNGARLANLYSILALSAYHLSRNPSNDSTHSSEHWKRMTTRSYTLAKERIHQSLMTEVHGVGRAKYKDQLMAISGMTAFAVRTTSLTTPSHIK